MENTTGMEAEVDMMSLTNILKNWLSTLFAYQPEVYFQLDEYRRKLSKDFVSPEVLQDRLLKSGLLSVQSDEKNPLKLYLRLDSDVFSMARGKMWMVNVKKKGKELEFTCAEEQHGEDVAQLH
jgi:hypothetical protein